MLTVHIIRFLEKSLLSKPFESDLEANTCKKASSAGN